MTETEIRHKIEEFTHFAHRGPLNIVRDTTEFMSIQAGDLLDLGGKLYLVRGEEMEGRFGLDGEPKFWVKRAIDLADGSIKVIKLVFLESFMMQLGDLSIRCIRSPQKESRILDKIRGDHYFMQGFTVHDSAGNPVRIIDKIQGKRFYDFLPELASIDHKAYFESHFPTVFDNVLGCIEAIARLHASGEVHGDIRNDHIFIERGTGSYRWIDFDYTYDWAENPFGVDLFGLGNVLLFTIGKGFHNLRDPDACSPDGMRVTSCLTSHDMSLFFKHRIINLKKLFPYIPESLNQILLHFSCGAEVFYEHTLELLEDLRECRKEIPPVDTASQQ